MREQACTPARLSKSCRPNCLPPASVGAPDLMLCLVFDLARHGSAGGAATPRQIGAHALAGEPVGALVQFVAGVTPDPEPLHLVPPGRRVEPAPEVLVLDRLLVGGAPAVALPDVEPTGHAAAQILRVRVQAHQAGALQRLERLDRRRELHAVVGGERLAALQLLLLLAVAKHRAPAAGPRVARAGAVGPDRDSSAHRTSP